MDAKKKHLGMTVIEWLVVTTIVGILAGIAVPSYLSFRERQEQAKATTPRPVSLFRDRAQCWAHRGKFIAGGNGSAYTIPDNQQAFSGETRHGRGPHGSNVCGPQQIEVQS